MLNTILWTIKKRGFKIFILATFYYLKILLFKILKIRYIKKNIYNFKMLLDVYDKGLSRTLLLFSEREIEQKFIIEKIAYIKEMQREEGEKILDQNAIDFFKLRLI